MIIKFVQHSRTEPARTILMLVAALTVIAQAIAFGTGGWAWVTLPNLLIVAAVCLWAFGAGWRNNVRQMSLSSFWLFMMWLWSGLSRLAFAPDASLMLWAPFVVVAAVLSVVYIYLSHQKKGL